MHPRTMTSMSVHRAKHIAAVRSYGRGRWGRAIRCVCIEADIWQWVIVNPSAHSSSIQPLQSAQMQRATALSAIVPPPFAAARHPFFDTSDSAPPSTHREQQAGTHTGRSISAGTDGLSVWLAGLIWLQYRRLLAANNSLFIELTKQSLWLRRWR